MDETGLERDEYNGKSSQLFQKQSPGSHTKRRTVFLNRKMIKKTVLYSGMFVTELHVHCQDKSYTFCKEQQCSFSRQDEKDKDGGGNSEPCFLLLLNSCPC